MRVSRSYFTQDNSLTYKFVNTGRLTHEDDMRVEIYN